MEILIQDEGVCNALYKIESDLANALRAKNKHEKQKFLARGYGGVVAIIQMLETIPYNADEHDNTRDMQQVTSVYSRDGIINNCAVAIRS